MLLVLGPYSINDRVINEYGAVCGMEISSRNQSTLNPRYNKRTDFGYNGQNVAVYNFELLEMLGH
jgi:hypothetical protein